MRALTLLAALTLATTAPFGLQAQWTVQTPTTADLRGIDNVGKGVAWASGTNGTVLRTEDAGYLWQTCTIPPGAEHLDFRGIQAFDANTAIVMSSGTGDQSRLYKTTDGCQTWTLLFTNSDKNGFWDAVVARVIKAAPDSGCGANSQLIIGSILGDPTVHKVTPVDKTDIPSFYLANFEIGITCDTHKLVDSPFDIFSLPGEGAFAASNSVLERLGPGTYWIAVGRRLIQYNVGLTEPSHFETARFCDIAIPISRHSETAGVFSFAIQPNSIEPAKATKVFGNFHCQKASIVVVGGDYTAINDRQNTAAFTGGNNKFQLAQTMPMGFRSAVAYDAPTKTWITVGPNGTDISTDDGRNWRALKPSASEAPDTAQHWNALSLPYAVGPHGRIGILNPSALKPASTKP